MEAAGGSVPPQQQQPAVPPQPPAPSKAERLNPAVQQQLNLESMKTRALSLYKAISRILEDFDVIARSNAEPKWQDVLGQYMMVNMELYNIVEDIKKVSKSFVVHPKNVTVENSTILPVMLSSKLLPEMEAEDNSKREQLLCGITNLPVPTQVEKLKARMEMIATACDTAEKVIADARKAYGLGSRQGPSVIPTLDRVQAAKIQEQENLLRAAVNTGEGLRVSGDQRPLPSSLPSHLVDVLTFGDGAQNFGDNGGAFQKNTSPFSSNPVNTQGAGQALGGQLMGRSVPSPSGISGATSFDNASTPPLPYANSPRSGTNIMSTPSPQQQTQQQQQQLQQQQQRQKYIQQQQILAQQHLRQSPTQGMLGQNTISQLHDMQGQAQHKFQQLQYSQPLEQQQFQNRQLQTAQMQQNIAQSQINQGNQLRNHLSQFPGSNSALFNAAQTSPNSQMITNISATMQSPSLLPRMQQFGLSSGHPQRTHPSQILSDQMFGMGAPSPPSMLAMQQQQHGNQGAFGNMATNAQNLQSGLVTLPNTTAQNTNFPQQRQQNQQ